jgi:DNA-binding NarL/FixJ family response regulator
VAADAFASSGAPHLQARASQEQRLLGVRVPTGGARGARSLLGLSPREREVAKLLCEGRTNADIAQSLYLSVRTVETHVKHIFAKLGVTSRAAAATALSRDDFNSA